MRAKNLLAISAVSLLSVSAITACGQDDKSDKYVDGKLKISLRNLYFTGYGGGDIYVQKLEDEFGVKFTFQSYSWDDWDTQVNGQINGGSLPDVFHANIDSYNYMSYYKFWADEHIIKPLPDDLSPWPNVKSLIDHTSNIEALKIDGKLYGIPIAQETTNYDTIFSPFTYMYRRDWVKKIDESHRIGYEEDGVTPIYQGGYTPIYKEGDVYTWTEFEHLLDVLSKELRPQSKYALGDVEWGFPSITNFYKQVPHCFAFDEVENKYVNNYLTPEYLAGLQKSQDFMKDNEMLYYFAGQNSAAEGDVRKEYMGNKIGVFYENLSYTNFMNIRSGLLTSNIETAGFNIEDATAIMKIKSPVEYGGQYCLEGTDNWFSMTFFDRKISDTKMEKMLDVYDYLLSKKGTFDAIYGIEGYEYDYDPVTETATMIEDAWEQNSDGTYKAKENGCKYIRQMVSLGYDTYAYDPVTNKAVVNYLNDWENEMKAAYVPDDVTTPDVNENETMSGLRILKENEEVRWLTSFLKATFSGGMRDDALLNVMKYVYKQISLSQYQSSFAASGYDWPGVLNEINTELGYN